jgi:multidrug efflux pump subunit AcrB
LLQLNNGMSLYDAVISAAMARTRPILITAVSTMVGAAIILTDPIFQGMAISLLFGLLVSTILTLVVVPLGCLSIGEETFRKVAQRHDCCAD